MLGLSRQMSVTVVRSRTAVLPLTESPFARPEVVDISTYKYPGDPKYLGIGPKAIPEEWEPSERTVHYVIPKTFDEFLTEKMGHTGKYTVILGGALALLSKQDLVITAHEAVSIQFFFTCCMINLMVGKDAKAALDKYYTEHYDMFYACKEHDIAAYTEIVGKYKEAQEQAKGQALYNAQKLTNLALMLETEYLQRKNSLVDSVTKKLNYQVAIQNALVDQEKKHMINWIENGVNEEISKIDQDEMIRVCVANLKNQ